MMKYSRFTPRFNFERHKIYEGKGKILFDGTKPSTLIQHFKDEITVDGNPTKIRGRGAFRSKFSESFMSKLREIGIKTHYINVVGFQEQLIHALEMFPFRVLVRNMPSQGFREKFGLDENMVFRNPIIEYFYKTDVDQEVMVNNDHIQSFLWATEEDLKSIEAIALRINDFFRGYFLATDLRLFTIAMEFGKYHEYSSDGEYEIMLGDELTPESLELIDLRESIHFHTKRETPDDVIAIYRDLAERIHMKNPITVLNTMKIKHRL